MSLTVTAELRALAHPLRLRMLSLLTAAPMTAAEVARELALTHANASYHLRRLHAAGTIKLASEEHIRGGVAKRYRYDLERGSEPRSYADDLSEHRAVHNAMATELRRRTQHFKPTPGHSTATDAELWVDPEVWRQIRERVRAASLDLHRAAQAPRSPGAIRVNATVAMFEMEPQA